MLEFLRVNIFMDMGRDRMMGYLRQIQELTWMKIDILNFSLTVMSMDALQMADRLLDWSYRSSVSCSKFISNLRVLVRSMGVVFI